MHMMGCTEESVRRVWKLRPLGYVLQEHSLQPMKRGYKPDKLGGPHAGLTSSVAGSNHTGRSDHKFLTEQVMAHSPGR